MKKVIFVPADNSDGNKKFNTMFTNSLRKFHPDIEVRMFGNTTGDRDFWYRAKPIIACQLFSEGYDMVIGMDNDQIITGSLDEMLNDEEDYDVGVVMNDPSWPIQIFDIKWPYYNNGLVVLKSKEFAEHWKKICFSNHFYRMQYREQDVLNILCSDYMNYRVKELERTKIYGEFAKPQWLKAYLKDKGLYIKIPGYTNNGITNPDIETQICVVHFGGGSTPDKGNYRLRFQPEVVKYLDELVK